MPVKRKAATAERPGRKPLAVEYWPLDRLIPYVRNARTHSEAQIAEIAGSIRAFGFANPILVGSGGDIVAGHGRLLQNDCKVQSMARLDNVVSPRKHVQPRAPLS